MGLPAIAFDVGGIREWLRPGENGLLVAPGSGAAGLADAIVSMLSEASVRGQMSIGARAVATEMSRALTPTGSNAFSGLPGTEGWR